MTRHRAVRLQAAAVLSLLVADCSAVSADCRREVEAAFQRLEIPGRPYRRETTMAISNQVAEALGVSVGGRGGQTIREIAEVIPPDRRKITIVWGEGRRPDEAIQVGQRGWILLEDVWHEGGIQLVKGTEIFPNGVGRRERTFECLGTVELESKTYAGYRTIVEQTFVRIEQPEMSKKQREENLAELKQQPKVWRTILVDRDTGLPTYEMSASESRLDSPKWRMQYTYPRDITIEPPMQ